MGVIHKLKDEVVEFIIAQKKSNPSIGVRKLAEITSDKFQIKVSKSSVNSTLKNAELSSAVGRRPGEKSKPAKFSIPTSRKKEISKNMERAGYVKEQKTEKPPAPSPKQKPPVPKPLPVESRARKADKEEFLHLMPDPVEQVPPKEPVKEAKSEQAEIESAASSDEEFHQRIESIRARQEQQKIGPFKGMGYVFLKAAQWELSGRPIIADILKKHLPGAEGDIYDVACEMYIFLRHLGVSGYERVGDFQKHGLWALNRSHDQKLDENDVLMKMKELFAQADRISEKTALSIAVEYGLEKKQASTGIIGFELKNESGTSIVFDADLSGFGHGRATPINKAMIWLSHYLISNVDPPAFYVVPGEQKFGESFYQSAAFFENLDSRRVIKATAVGSDRQPVADFDTIPAQKRYFSIGVSPDQKEFADLTKNVKWSGKNPYFHEESGRTVFFGETKTEFLSGHLSGKIDDYRVMALWKDRTESPFWAILTNIDHETAEAVVGTYMSRWPRIGDQREQQVRGPSDARPASTDQEGDITQKGDLSFRDIFSDYIKELSRYCQRRYFLPEVWSSDSEEMTRRFYDLSGTYYNSDSYISVELQIPEESSHRKILEYAIGQVNEQHILDNMGKKLWIRSRNP